MIVGFYAERMLHYSIFSKCYTLDSEDKDEKEKEMKVTSIAPKIKDP